MKTDQEWLDEAAQRCRLINKYIVELADKPPRDLAIVSVALLDEQLGALLASHMHIESAEQRPIFREYGTLHQFSAKVDAAYAFGVITKQLRDELSTLAGIRNRFAHDLRIDSFEAAKVVDRCANLNLVETSNPYARAGLSMNGDCTVEGDDFYINDRKVGLAIADRHRRAILWTPEFGVDTTKAATRFQNSAYITFFLLGALLARLAFLPAARSKS